MVGEGDLLLAGQSKRSIIEGSSVMEERNRFFIVVRERCDRKRSFSQKAAVYRGTRRRLLTFNTDQARKTTGIMSKYWDVSTAR